MDSIRLTYKLWYTYTLYHYVCDRIFIELQLRFLVVCCCFCEVIVFRQHICINITDCTKADCVCYIYTPRVSLLFRMPLFAQYVARRLSVGALSTRFALSRGFYVVDWQAVLCCAQWKHARTAEDARRKACVKKRGLAILSLAECDNWRTDETGESMGRYTLTTGNVSKPLTVVTTAAKVCLHKSNS